MTMIFSGRVIDIKPGGEFLVSGHTDDVIGFINAGYQDAVVQLKDSRRITDKQRKLIWALIRQIANYSGHTPKQMQEYLKHEFITSRDSAILRTSLSMSNTDMTTAGQFINWIVQWMIDNDVSSQYPLYSIHDNLQKYVYQCYMHRTCCVCGIKADLHHLDRIGMGANRDQVAQQGMHVMTLCRQHHTLIHSIGQGQFFKRFHIHGIRLTRSMMQDMKNVYHFTGNNIQISQRLGLTRDADTV